MVKSKKKKKVNRRSANKYPALDPSLNLKTRYELISDLDYIHKLSKKDKEWLNKFMEEYVNDKLDREDLSNNMHNTQELKKDCDDRNNSRNRCIMTRSKAAGQFTYLEDLNTEDRKQDSQEVLNFKIDLNNHFKKRKNNTTK